MQIRLDQVAKNIYKKYGGRRWLVVVYNPSEFSNFSLHGYVRVNRQTASNLSSVMECAILTNGDIKSEFLPIK